MRTKNYPALVAFCLAVLFFSGNGQAAGTIPESACYGTTSNGKLENGVKLPSNGDNFKAYSTVGVISGRTYVHSKVYEAITNSYNRLAETHPDRVFMYGETGFKNGGKFKPHKTHQNGLSVDFMVLS